MKGRDNGARLEGSSSAKGQLHQYTGPDSSPPQITVCLIFLLFYQKSIPNALCSKIIQIFIAVVCWPTPFKIFSNITLSHTLNHK